LAIDGSERRQCPTGPAPGPLPRQKEGPYQKNIVLINEQTGKVAYPRPTIPGKTHDKKAGDETAMVYPANATLARTSAFKAMSLQGF
jgi:hypothetical protein